jgi:L-threonylcarbamoyladenylate synthase
MEWLGRVALFNSPEEQKLVEKLASAFWPGPLTMILKKQPGLSDLVTAGAETVAVRVTAHPIFQEVLRRLDSPLAAPSANRFGRISPTTAEDVRNELGESISLVIDGGSCFHGMESTIISIHDGGIEILRPGPITKEQLLEYGHVSLASGIVNTPGSLPGHYAPKTRLHIIETDIKVHYPQANSGLLAFTTPAPEVIARYQCCEVLSMTSDLREAAANFYGALRKLDNSKVDMIVAESLPEQGIGVAIMDRMKRASYGSRHLGMTL